MSTYPSLYTSRFEDEDLHRLRLQRGPVKSTSSTDHEWPLASRKRQLRPPINESHNVSTQRSSSAPYSPTRLMHPLPPLPSGGEYDLEAQKPFGRTVSDSAAYQTMVLRSGRYTAEDRKLYLKHNSKPSENPGNNKMETVTSITVPSTWWIARKIESFLEKIAEALYDRVEAGQDPERDLLLPVMDDEREGGEYAKRLADLGYI